MKHGLKFLKAIPWWAAVLGILLLVNFAFGFFAVQTRWHNNAIVRTYGKKISLVNYHTNDLSGIGIVDVETGEPLWVEWRNREGIPDQVRYFHHGTNVFNYYFKEGERPKYEAIFHAPDGSKVLWEDVGSGSFTERISYDGSGKRSGFERWYKDAWHPVDRRNNQNGIVIDGQWLHLEFDTNRNWVTEPGPKANSN